ncbi:phosphoenolpyruvate--protein phosphotransferase [Porticoccaceae bacterium]|jgi:phosphotransferase system enzyme I (PtsP)|nr:phosphoenolpyruvate--protein phosphotransferase [Porticoccaceae bacterium]MDB2382529.1 phosphoenolpyruvate--protein phosphotransferase [Porticoccaceae bacterium]MDB2620882.1 phosphoenolpyruvate--protein phosphotransferase [Porticoccaceae bacterium]MDB2669364.1 phosphoenolpyruvate--protein phosphotransferase [Porticoccaceae bacterium]MDC0523852.1 phosphoenolpyruvate--protein phosphotransferase [Porticoccaceae bacterium]
MLSSLRTIVQEVNSARSLSEVLAIIVKEVRDAMSAGVCSVYLFDESDQNYVLMATEGLRQESIGKVRMAMREGLVGLVAAKEEPLNLQDADQHPNFAYFEETGEAPFHSFLGVPIIHHRKVLGVLVLQQETRRRFASEEEAFVVTVCAQLSGAIAHAEATGALRQLASAGRGKSKEAVFPGIPSSSGVGIGRVVLVTSSSDLKMVPERLTDNPSAEVKLFREALKATKRDMRNLGNGLSGKLSAEEFALFEVYIRLLDDRVLINEVISAIKLGQAAPSAWSTVILKHVRTFQKMDDPYLRERAADVNDLGVRVLGYLQAKDKDRAPMPRRIVLVGEDLSATALADIPVHRLVGIISLKGSSNSHMAIVGRALGIPTVMGAINLPWVELEGQELIVDGSTGDVISRATRSVRRHYVQRQREEKLFNKDLEKLRNIPCHTPDGIRFSLWVNTGLRQDTARSLKSGAEAVGLFRTEIPFLMRTSFPTEDEQIEIYREQLSDFAPRPVTMRTLDIGGDKDLPYFPIEEENPFLGWRGIRISLDHPEIFLVQIRAMLRASEGINNLRIMLPMISNVPELDRALQLIERAYQELTQEEGYTIKRPLIGAMIEVPAAVYQVKEIGRRVDFMSVGTNDLTQYLLAVDRNNPRVADLYHTLHPSVLRALKQIYDQASSVNCQLSICGEMAGDPLSTVILLGLGYETFSMSASSLLRVKSILLNVSRKDAKLLSKKALKMSSSKEIITFLAQSLNQPDVIKLLKTTSPKPRSDSTKLIA